MKARRSCLSVPGSSDRMLAKAMTLAADELVLDLEDAVAVAAKDEARDLVSHSLQHPGWQGRTVAVRVNAPGTPWCHADLIALAAEPGALTSVVVPKVESPGDLAFVDRLLDGVETGPRLRVQALIETAAGLAAVDAIAAASPRLDALILGYADLAASLGRATDDLVAWGPAQDRVLVAARANGVQAIDGPYLGTQVDAGFLAASERARDLGFDGKWAIHPVQVEALNAIFTPSEDDVAQARRVLEALAHADRGAIQLDGQMLDEAVAVAARRTLARAGVQE